MQWQGEVRCGRWRCEVQQGRPGKLPLKCGIWNTLHFQTGVLWFCDCCCRYSTSCRTVVVKELMFWFRLTAFWGVLGSRRGRAASSQDLAGRGGDVLLWMGPDRIRTDPTPPHPAFSLPQAVSARRGEKHVLPSHYRGLTRTLGTPVSLILLAPCPSPSPGTRGPKPAESRGKTVKTVSSPFFLFFSSFVSPHTCAPLSHLHLGIAPWGGACV